MLFSARALLARRCSSSLTVSSSRLATTKARFLSSQNTATTTNTAATDKLYDILNEYREQHYTQEIPSRFVKEILKYTDKNHDGWMEESEFVEFLQNIGASNKLSETEVHDIMLELGATQPDNKVSIPKVQEAFLAELVNHSRK